MVFASLPGNVGGCGRAVVLGNFHTYLDNSRGAVHTALAVVAGGGCLDIFFFSLVWVPRREPKKIVRTNV